MAELKVTLDGDAIRDATTQAILGILPEETKAKILEQAVIALLTPSTDSWAKKKSPIELAFETAVERIAREEAVKLVAGDETIRTRLNDLLRKVADQILSVDIDKMTQRMADSFVNSMRRG